MCTPKNGVFYFEENLNFWSTFSVMISENLIREKLETYLESKGLFIIDISISPHNQIEITIDGDNYVSIDECVDVSRYVESFLNRDEEDFALTISSPDANKPLQIPRQYPKHIGKEISIITTENKEYKGKLTAADTEGIKVLIKLKENRKTKIIEEEIYLPFQKIKKAKILLPF